MSLLELNSLAICPRPKLRTHCQKQTSCGPANTGWNHIMPEQHSDLHTTAPLTPTEVFPHGSYQGLLMLHVHSRA